ncbi:hypothetical protein CROQUDRAFT_98595 [Cronartium quercuum f. sp. fusiforme G11]|uniref:Uncharacterized protein n=1 Tax=Cronartium quercuum f. sp. fusiforme G11 TaxID=708437 RepID=A0A9P6T7H7_9BASI|nr:hypothetical protein CROQUDRAFT_98595 [Cronartium quercuum f. sp. fusiforme G11]
MQSFLGFAGYYRNYLPHYGKITKGSTKLEAKDDLLHEFHPDYDKPFKLLDASFEGLFCTKVQILNEKPVDKAH